jgi:hypothetical protein
VNEIHVGGLCNNAVQQTHHCLAPPSDDVAKVNTPSEKNNLK